MNAHLTAALGQFDINLPLQQARTIPSSWYTWPEVELLERTTVFARSWQMVGRREHVATPGQYLTAEVAGEPVLVIRGDDHILRAFHNVCRHRAARLCANDCGVVTKLRCHYHGWTYDLAGQLRGVPEFEGVEGFRREENGLPPVAVDEWGPFVWVSVTQPNQSLADFLAPLPQWSQTRSAFVGLKWHSRKVYDLECNWKVYVDNYLDGGYHINTVHPDLAGVLDYREYRTECSGHTVLQSSPMIPGEGETGRTRTGDLAAYWWIYPNFMMNVYAGVMDTNLVVPLGVNRCRVIFDFYFAETLSDEFKSESLQVADQVQAEDIGVCEEVQRNLRGQSFTTGRYSVKRENGQHHFHVLLAQALQAAVI